MSVENISMVKWREKIEDWYKDPQELLAWIMKLFWQAEIKPDDPVSWLTKKGKIMIFGDIKIVEKES